MIIGGRSPALDGSCMMLFSAGGAISVFIEAPLSIIGVIVPPLGCLVLR